MVTHEDDNLLEGWDGVWTMDDDQIADCNVLETLEKEMVEGVGAVAGLVLKPPAGPLPAGVDGTLDDIWRGQSLQWYVWSGSPRSVEHLHSTFLYRPRIAHWDLRLSRKAFRGETMLSHSLYRRGLKLLVTPHCTTWHLEAGGGCRTKEAIATNTAMYEHDSAIFQSWLAFQKTGKKLFVIDGGLGDHYLALQALEISRGAVVACCFPELFKEMDVQIISIAAAEQIVNKKNYDVYEWCERKNWRGTLLDAYRALYQELHG
jgi:hypothetical protein